MWVTVDAPKLPSSSKSQGLRKLLYQTSDDHTITFTISSLNCFQTLTCAGVHTHTHTHIHICNTQWDAQNGKSYMNISTLLQPLLKFRSSWDYYGHIIPLPKGKALQQSNKNECCYRFLLRRFQVSFITACSGHKYCWKYNTHLFFHTLHLFAWPVHATWG